LPEERVVDAGQASLVRLVHGSPGGSFEGLDPIQAPEALRSALERVREPVLVCGHTHLSWKVELGGKLALNPGAVCGPLNGDPRAQYAVLTWQGGRWHAEHRGVAVDQAGYAKPSPRVAFSRRAGRW
jgi:predicted phosphodiesterase